MWMKGKLAILAAASMSVAGCATSPTKITSNYVSPVKYGHYTCGQLAMELERVQTQANQLHARLEGRRTNDKIMVGVGLLVAWPALLLIKGNNSRKAEYAQLKGDYEALMVAHNAQRCNVTLDANMEMPATPVSHTSFDEGTFRKLLFSRDCVPARRMAMSYGSNYHQRQVAEVCGG